MMARQVNHGTRICEVKMLEADKLDNVRWKALELWELLY